MLASVDFCQASCVRSAAASARRVPAAQRECCENIVQQPIYSKAWLAPKGRMRWTCDHAACTSFSRLSAPSRVFSLSMFGSRAGPRASTSICVRFGRTSSVNRPGSASASLRVLSLERVLDEVERDLPLRSKHKLGRNASALAPFVVADPRRQGHSVHEPSHRVGECLPDLLCIEALGRPEHGVDDGIGHHDWQKVDDGFDVRPRGVGVERAR